MTTLINDTFFVRELTIGSSDSTAVANALQQAINVYEPEFLYKVMGVAFAQLFLDNIAEQRFQDLLNGKVYEYEGTTYRWQGLVNATAKISPIANYVYYKYVRQNAIVMSGVGATVNNAENSTRVSPTDKLVFAWQDMVKMNHEMYYYLTRNSDIYPEFRANEWYEGFNSGCGWVYHKSRINPLYNINFINRVGI